MVVQGHAENKDKKLRTSSFSGKVLGGGEDLTGVKVILDNKEIIVYTDFDGNFTIENVRAGEHKISFSLVAYKNKEVTVNSINTDQLVINLYGK
jgi:hypothetical protein